MSAKISILTNIPAPYRIPVFRSVASRVDLQVIFDARSEPNRAWRVREDFGFRHAYANGAALPYSRNSANPGASGERYLQLRYDIVRHLRRFRPDVVISGEMGVRTAQGEIYCRMAGIPLIIWSEGTPHTEGWVSGYKQRIRRHFVRSAARFWTNGAESSALLERYGAAGEKIDSDIMAVDPGLFMSEVDDCYRMQRDAVRRSLGLEGVTFCFLGEFIARKGIKEYLEALRRLRSISSHPFSALFVGDGPERNAMESWSRANRIPLVITGFRQQAELPRFYAAADVFALPSLEDNWALVTLEAAFAGLPQIFSRFNGATADLMAAGAPGIVVNPYDISSLGGALESYLISSPERTPDTVRKRIARIYSPEACAIRMCRSIERVLHLENGSLSGEYSSAAAVEPRPTMRAALP